MPKLPFLENQEMLRNKLLDLERQLILISKIENSNEAEDEYTQINCAGYGRIRNYTSLKLHFNQRPSDRLIKASPSDPEKKCRTQVFQLAGCDFRCWYCFVDSALLIGDIERSSWFSAKELVDLALNEPNPPSIIDLSGGQPELVPEWCYWVMKDIEKRGLINKISVWSDDNLSCDFFWSKLSPEQRNYIANFPGHYRSVCIKGLDKKSFSANTGAPPFLFDRQLLLLEKLINEGIQLEVYLTMLDIPRPEQEAIAIIDSLQMMLFKIHPALPCKVVPLRVSAFKNLFQRANRKRLATLGLQMDRSRLWNERLKLDDKAWNTYQHR